MSEGARCQLCGEPMPAGEEMFNYHGYSGPCPKMPLPKPVAIDPLERCVSLLETMAKEQLRFAEEEANEGGSDGDTYEHAAGLLEKAINEIRSWQKT